MILIPLLVICCTGLKVDLSSASDLTEANALGHMSNYVQVYSSSWGPNDFGFIVEGPGPLAKRTFETGAAEVSVTYFTKYLEGVFLENMASYFLMASN